MGPIYGVKMTTTHNCLKIIWSDSSNPTNKPTVGQMTITPPKTTYRIKTESAVNRHLASRKNRNRSKKRAFRREDIAEQPIPVSSLLFQNSTTRYHSSIYVRLEKQSQIFDFVENINLAQIRDRSQDVVGTAIPRWLGIMAEKKVFSQHFHHLESPNRQIAERWAILSWRARRVPDGGITPDCSIETIWK